MTQASNDMLVIPLRLCTDYLACLSRGIDLQRITILPARVFVSRDSSSWVGLAKPLQTYYAAVETET